MYERKVVAEIRTRSDRQEAFPALERDQSVRSGSFMRQALRGDIFMVRSLCIMLLLPCRAVCLCSCFLAALCACALARLESPLECLSAVHASSSPTVADCAGG